MNYAYVDSSRRPTSHRFERDSNLRQPIPTHMLVPSSATATDAELTIDEMWQEKASLWIVGVTGGGHGNMFCCHGDEACCGSLPMDCFVDMSKTLIAQWMLIISNMNEMDWNMNC